MSSHVRAFLLNLALVLGSLLAAVGMLEVALRVVGFSHVAFYRADDRLGLRLRADIDGRFTGEGKADVRTNSAGFRDRDRVEQKPAGRYRIAVLGDSYVEALQVDLEETFPAQLERRLNGCGAFGGKKVEVLNFGVSGYGTAQQLLTFRHFASRYSPDLVISAVFTGNDIRNNSRELEPDKVRPFFVVEGDSLIEDRSFATSEEFRRRTNALRAVLDRLRFLRVVQAAYFAKERVQQPGAAQASLQPGASEAGLDDAVFAEPTTPDWRNAWLVTERLFAQLQQEVRASGARLLIVSLSSGIQVHPDPHSRSQFLQARGASDIFYPDRRIEGIAARLKIDSIVLAPELQQIAERNKIFLHGFPNTRMGTGHWNEAGHRAAAELVAARLCRGAASTQP
jgi:lysophospholipase L1-like esterase